MRACPRSPVPAYCQVRPSTWAVVIVQWDIVRRRSTVRLRNGAPGYAGLSKPNQTKAALRVPLMYPSPQRWLDDHGDELELPQADQNPLAFPVSATRPQSRWPATGTGRRLETRPLGRGPAANWSGRKHPAPRELHLSVRSADLAVQKRAILRGIPATRLRQGLVIPPGGGRWLLRSAVVSAQLGEEVGTRAAVLGYREAFSGLSPLAIMDSRVRAVWSRLPGSAW